MLLLVLLDSVLNAAFSLALCCRSALFSPPERMRGGGRVVVEYDRLINESLFLHASPLSGGAPQGGVGPLKSNHYRWGGMGLGWGGMGWKGGEGVRCKEESLSPTGDVRFTPLQVQVCPRPVSFGL